MNVPITRPKGGSNLKNTTSRIVVLINANTAAHGVANVLLDSRSSPASESREVREARVTVIVWAYMQQVSALVGNE